ncbi:MAG: RnfABCDGE type electron transport complex subunit G [Candidatus Omnitrophota bacterium]
MQSNNYLKFGLTLLVICLVASGLLTSVYSLTKDKIEAQREDEETIGLREVLPRARDFKFIDKAKNSYYIGTDARGNIVGYVFITQKKGYSSDIITMVGIDSNGIIQAIKILSQNETPGLGSKIVEVKEDKTKWSVPSEKSEKRTAPKPWFQEQFKGKNVDSLDQVETITGATISSTAVIDSIKEKAEIILREIKYGR